jgi:hypothetical protein
MIGNESRISAKGKLRRAPFASSKFIHFDGVSNFIAVIHSAHLAGHVDTG